MSFSATKSLASAVFLFVFVLEKEKRADAGKDFVRRKEGKFSHGHGKTRKKNPETNESDPRSSGFFLVFRPCENLSAA